MALSGTECHSLPAACTVQFQFYGPVPATYKVWEDFPLRSYRDKWSCSTGRCVAEARVCAVEIQNWF